MHAEVGSWSDQVLQAVTARLTTSTVTDAASVEVRQLWADGPLSVCVVFRRHQGPWMGLRRHADDARDAILAEGDSWDVGMTAAYDMGDDAVVADELPDPVRFAWNVVDFDLGEPVEPQERWPRDRDGVAWWGRLENGTAPSASRPREDEL